ncbi:MAG TPA: hypothetical protein VHP14_09620 [Anaerolineales bacterium]|nr:hypothetical protein [Anaerolineales bacterium]
MNDRDKKEILDFLANDKQLHRDKLLSLLNALSSQLNYKIKIQRASIQLIHRRPFAVIGFRRKANCFFVEFYNDRIIESDRVIKTNQRDSFIIHTVNVSMLSDIDDDLLEWMKHSSELVDTD